MLKTVEDPSIIIIHSSTFPFDTLIPFGVILSLVSDLCSFFKKEESGEVAWKHRSTLDPEVHFPHPSLKGINLVPLCLFC